jgi:hypothetical protein
MIFALFWCFAEVFLLFFGASQGAEASGMSGT